jgi:hypothetical protein
MIVSPHQGQGLDGTVYRICEQIKSPIPIVPITRINDFKFNTDLFRLADYVLLDFIEYDWNWNFEKSGTHLFGHNSSEFHHFNTDEWKKFDTWVNENPPKVYFKRELLNVDNSPSFLNVVPIDYPCWLQQLPPIVSKEEFNKRPLDLFWFWGRSHEERLKLHGEIWMYASEKGYSVCDNLTYLPHFLQHESGKKMVTVNIPHYCRIPIEAILGVNGLSKISVALPGAGRKTFRGTGESPVNSVVLMMEDNLAYSYPFEHKKNCLKFEEFGQELDVMEDALNNPNLYDIYVNGVKNCENYLIENYTKNYIERIINESL